MNGRSATEPVLARVVRMPAEDLPAESQPERWAAAAQPRIDAMVGAAAVLRTAFDARGDIAPDTDAELGSRLLATCDDLHQWLQNSPAPDDYREAHAELGAAIGVFRNAAFAFRSLPGAAPDRLAARSQGCELMLDQGNEHIQAFTAKLPPQPPD